MGHSVETEMVECHAPLTVILWKTIRFLQCIDL